MSRYRPWLAVAAVAYAGVDVVRRFFAAERWFLLAVDVFLIATLVAYFYHDHRWREVGRHGRAAAVMVGVLATIVVLGTLNPWWIDLTTTLAGLRSYLLPMPFLLVGYHAASHWTPEQRLASARLVLWLAGAAIAVGLYQLFTDYAALTGTAALLLTPLEHAVHSFGSEAIQLTSSFFASSKRFGRFLFFSFVLVWAFRREGRLTVWPLYLLFLAGIVASGSREAFVVYLAFLAAAWAAFGKYRRATAWGVSAAVALAATLWVSGRALTVDSRVDFLLSTRDPVEYLWRARMLFPLDRVDLTNEHVLLGHGIGKYGQEASLVPEIYQATDAMVAGLYQSDPIFGQLAYFADPAITKTIIEVGVVGTLGMLVGLGGLLWLVARGGLRALGGRRPAPFATALAAFAWALFAAKVHPVLSDSMAGTAFYFFAGFTIWQLDAPPAQREESADLSERAPEQRVASA